MHILEPGHVWAKQPTDKRCIMTGILPIFILRKETASFISINLQLCKLCLVVGLVPS